MNTSTRIDELVQRARDAMAGRQAGEALALTLQACELAPDNASLWLSAGSLAGQSGDLAKAEACLRKSLALNPASAMAHENLAVALAASGDAGQALVHVDKALALRDRAGTHNRRGFFLASLGRHTQAIAAFRAAIAREPDLAEAHNNLGVSLQASGDFDDALAAYARCIALEPGHADAWNNRGLALQAQGRIEEAADAHREALRIDPDNPALLAELAGTLERINALDEARKQVDRAIALDPSQQKARLVDAVLLRRAGDCETAVGHLEALLETIIDRRDAGEIEVELANCLDRIGRYAEAWAHNASGQQHLLASWAARPDSGEYPREIQQNRRWPLAEMTTANGPRSPAFLVGFPRSGTTLTGRVLDAHPGVVCSDEWPLIPRLLRHAVDDLGLSPGQLADQQRESLVEAYWKMAGEHDVERDGPRLLDKLPLNITRIGFIRQVFPDAPVIVALRDPRDACLSAFMQSFKPNRAMVHFSRYEDAANLYALVMRDWSELRGNPPDGFVESRYETLVSDFESSATRLLRHLGLEWDAGVAEFYRHSHGRYLSTPSYQAVAEPVNDRAIGRWRHYRDQIGQEGGALASFLEKFGYE